MAAPGSGAATYDTLAGSHPSRPRFRGVVFGFTGGRGSDRWGGRCSLTAGWFARDPGSDGAGRARTEELPRGDGVRFSAPDSGLTDQR